MSSVSSSTASRIAVTGASSVLAVGKNADGAAFAVKPAIAAQDPESDTPSPTDEVDITADAVEAAAAHPPPAPAAANSAGAAAAEAHQVVSPSIDPASEPIPPAAYNGTPPSLAAYAYAQTMQIWLKSKTARSPAARRPPKPDPQADG
jgi:hypothetical protein